MNPGISGPDHIEDVLAENVTLIAAVVTWEPRTEATRELTLTAFRGDERRERIGEASGGSPLEVLVEATDLQAGETLRVSVHVIVDERFGTYDVEQPFHLEVTLSG